MADAGTRATVAGEFVRLVLDFRLIVILLTAVWLRVDSRPAPLAFVLLLTTGITSFTALMRWDRIGRVTASHPSVLAADTVVGLLVIAVLGADAPFVFALVGTALLAGALYGNVGATVFAALLVTSHEAVALTDDTTSFMTVVTIPVLYPVAAFSAAAISRVFEQRATAQQRATAAATMEQVARDLHDTLAKTVQGVTFTAAALQQAADAGQDTAVRRHIDALQHAVTRAQDEARALMRDWRDTTDHGPLLQAVHAAAHEEARGTALDIEVRADHDDDLALPPDSHREVLFVVREAVRNVVAHAGATRATIGLGRATDDSDLVLSIADNGCGPPSTATMAARRADGHFGLLGIHERVQRIGGTWRLGAACGGGTEVRVRIPAEGRVPTSEQEVMT